MAAPSSVRLNLLLKEVSRSFYLTLRVLPGAVRPQIGLAYLLARSTDTIADTEILPLNQRLQALQSLRERILGLSQETLNVGELTRPQDASSKGALLERRKEALHNIEDVKLMNPKKIHAYGSVAEHTLLKRIEDILGVLDSFSSADRDLIRDVLSTIISGQEMDLKRFADARSTHLVALLTEEELDDYTWRVAGCVGEFWTRMCQIHLFPNAALDQARLVSNGIRFGKGLQLVNVLRDLPIDLRHGRCYLPAQALSLHDLAPNDLLQPENERRFRPVYEIFLHKAQEHLAAGWEYTISLPRRCVRVRLACAWPILIGVKTLARLRSQNVLDPQHRIKISRAEIRGLIARSIISYVWPAAWQRLFTRIAGS